ncbi:hypothetical protein G3578_10585 [Brevibacillus sp. SYP-B805]|uniref:Ig-like domain-containing protein n=1 Tax=Brevibacillus sp. SYP-B805 TaxID=1578199 RepID=UPI0013EBFA31|nr:Ig-like domain-containing protein [Brevibacillus sp. SYP-B805]NGQ95600.1 hypothetical protein [Brevibacillus sp. SYP-B805]
MRRFVHQGSKLLLFFVFLFALSLSGTGIANAAEAITGTDGVVTDKTVVRLKVPKTSVTLPIRGTYALSVQAIYSDKTSAEVTDQVTWTSSNANVAIVEEGKIKALAVGTARLTGTYNSKKVTVAVRVAGPTKVKEIAATNGSITVTLDKKPEVGVEKSDFSFQIKIDAKKPEPLTVGEFTWNDASQTASFTFEPVAVTSKKQKLIISVNYLGSKKTAKPVIVEESGAVSVIVIKNTAEDTELTLHSETDGTLLLQAILYDKNGNIITDKPVQWKSSNPKVAVVDEHGLVTAVSKGTAKIYATVDKVKSKEITVKVVEPKVPSVQLVTNVKGSKLSTSESGVFQVTADLLVDASAIQSVALKLGDKTFTGEIGNGKVTVQGEAQSSINTGTLVVTDVKGNKQEVPVTF